MKARGNLLAGGFRQSSKTLTLNQKGVWLVRARQAPTLTI